MLPTAARLLRLLSLLQTRHGFRGPELAERLEVTDRTLRRDIERLRQLGYPVHATSGTAGGYSLGAGAALPPLQLEDDEALAVSIALGSTAASGVSGIDEAALRALVKLEQVLPTRLRRRADALRATIVPLRQPAGGVRAALLSTLAGACRDHRELAFGYADGRGRTDRRRVEPLGLVHAGYRWYLAAWDIERADHRTFRVDRMQGDAEVGARFSPRPPPDGGDLRTYVSRSISTSPYPVQASVILHTSMEALAARLPPGAAQLEPLGPERCRLRAGAPALESLAGWVLAFGVDFEVESPKELLEHMSALHQRLDRVLGRRGRGPAKR